MSRIAPISLIPAWLLAGALTSLAVPPEEQMQFADGMYARGLFDMAAREYETLLRESPGFERNDTALYRLGECHRQLGDGKKAGEIYRRLAAEYPQSPLRFKGHLRRSELYVAAGKVVEAAQVLESLLDQDPPPDLAASAWYYLGYSRKRMLVLDAAETAFRKVIGDFADSPFASFAALELAGIYLQQPDKRQEARELYQRVADQPATPRVGAEGCFQLAELAFKDRDFAASAEAYARLLKKYPDDARAAEARLQAAWSYHNAGRYEDALALANASLKEAGGEAGAWLYLKANAARQLGQNDKAGETYDALLTAHPDSPMAAAASYEKALVSFREGNYEKVIQEFQQARPGGAAEDELEWLLAESYFSMKQAEQAFARYLKIVEQFPGSPHAPRSLFRAAAIRQEAEQYAAASELFRDLAEKYPAHELAPDALLSSAFCRAREPEYKEALKDWTRLLKEYPESEQAGDALFQKALAEMQLGRDDDARSSFGKFIKTPMQSGRTVEAHNWLGILLERAGKNEEAEQALRAALDGKPGAELGRKIRFRLATLLQKQGKEDESAVLLQQLLSTPARKEMPAPLLEWLARYLLDRKEWRPAGDAAEVLADTAAGDSWKQIGFCLLGRAHEGGGRPAQARTAFEQALKQTARTREGAESALYLGRLALDGEKFEDAETYFKKAGELSQASELLDIRAQSYYGLARTAGAGERWEDASRYFLGVAILFDNPDLTPECLYRAAEAFAKLGRTADREKTLAELKQRYPESVWTKELE